MAWERVEQGGRLAYRIDRDRGLIEIKPHHFTEPVILDVLQVFNIPGLLEHGLRARAASTGTDHIAIVHCCCLQAVKGVLR